ncbi:antibiotic biosynthesis monooxygenase family protein [Hymenobacter sp. GOD-10R]|uniref:putative quinol monooxygenase n=1 Tax=Hymenobacter sp. GOD-10R TaxID=3093922 RepID=UPI002D776C36|nr:antibiotic biosynthesis monooxygenase family protein [Hymenobacter sp. GOD-10R]WRQ27208.1 antibiotic biosynthesis monooxygenase family protein [Hymenobacter sp. GOD-10R]
MIQRVVRMTFRPDAVAEFLRLFEASQDRIRQAHGCRHLELWQDAEQPTIFCTYSHWDSVAVLDQYRCSTLFGEVWPATKALFMAPPLAFSVQHVVPTDAALLTSQG